MRLYICFIFVFSWSILYSQPNDGLVTYLSMDNDTIYDESGMDNDFIVINVGGFGCGVSGSTAYFDGTTSIEFLSDYNTYFRGNFTLSFAFKPTGGSGKQILFSKSTDCLGPKDFEISYTPSSHSLGMVISENFDKRLDFNVLLNPNNCWYHVDVVRSGPKTLLYVDGKLVRESNLDVRIDFTNSGFLSISQSVCIPDRAAMYEGFLDEVRIYNRPLHENELYQLYNRVHSILTMNDTLTYINTDVSIKVTDDCTTGYSWFPTKNVENPTQGNTRISTPEAGNFEYILTFTEEFCKTTDTIRIRVVDPGNVNCESLIMPSAFTPNDDGLNDIYKISNPFIIEELVRFQIFDRGGGLIFQTANLSEGWDGRYKGEYVPAGNYLYRIVHICQGEQKVLQGNVIVIR